MKKRMISLMLCAVLALSATACKKKDDGDTQTDKYYDYDLSSYITLGEYKGLEVKLFDTAASEEEINKAVDSYIKNTKFTEEVNKAAEKDDIVNIDYVGKVDGEAFDGGTAEGQEITLGSSGYIDGFDDGILGMKAGETKDIQVTFPDPYQPNEDLSGKPAVFTITLNSVKKQVEGQLTDEFLAAHSETYKTVEALKEAQKAMIESSKQSAESDQNTNSTLQAVLEKAEIKSLPEKELAKNQENIKKTVESNYSQYTAYGYFSGTTEEFISAFYGTDVETAEEFYKKQAENQTRMELVLAAVAEAEKMKVTDQEYNELADSYADYNYDSKESFLENVGGEGYLRWYLLYNKAMDFLMENTKFLDKDGNVTVYPSPTPVPTEAPTAAPTADSSNK